MTTPLPPAALDAPAPTSRSTFRLLARCLDVTNREADALRHALLARWDEAGGSAALVDRLQSLDRTDPEGTLGVESRLAVWFACSDPGDGRLVADDDPVMADLPIERRSRLAGVARPAAE